MTSLGARYFDLWSISKFLYINKILVDSRKIKTTTVCLLLQ